MSTIPWVWRRLNNFIGKYIKYRAPVRPNYRTNI